MPELIESLLRSNSPAMSISSTTHDGTAATDVRPAPESQDQFDRLKDILREMFQLDRGDLDFGLYRIMRMKAAEIEAFLDRDLLPQVKTVLEGIADEDRGRIEAELDQTIKQLKALKAPTENNEKVIDLRKRLAEAKEDAAAEAEVYNHLANFFDRYYDEGDFMPLRRYTSGGKATYLIPYDGEEVKLHWANADQYYIKTTENYASYAFAVGEREAARRTWFEIAAADNEKDNIKEAGDKQRRFVLADGGDAVAVEGADLVVRFEHRPLTDAEKKSWRGKGAKQQDQINEASASRIEAALERLEPDWRTLLNASAPTDANPARTVLARHIERYTAKNSFDYFIHKDLGSFLRRELDFYLKNEILNLDDLALGDEGRLSRVLARMRAVRHVAEKIIAFLAQLEDFQKRLWLKKKFVLEIHWCVTLDRVPESLYPEIATNEAQRLEWVDLFAIDEIEANLSNAAAYSEPLTAEFLNANPNLVLDTRHFGSGFADLLLAHLSDVGPLDEQSDGLLVHGENFQALNLLQARYCGRVKCIYIDPPYNSPSSEIIYKNGYKHSTYLSLIQDRIVLSRSLMQEDSVHVLAIDENEYERVSFLLKSIFHTLSHTTVTIVHNPSGQQGENFSYSHDYACFAYGADRGQQIGNEVRENGDERNFRDVTGEDSKREAAKNCFYPIHVKGGKIVEFGDVCEPNFHPMSMNVPVGDGIVAVFPIDPQGVERKWRFARSTVGEIADELFPHYLKKRKEWDIKRLKNTFNYKTVWTDAKYSGNNHGTQFLNNMFGFQKFDYPKSIYTVINCLRAALNKQSNSFVLDYFAGSGTTGHAVIDLNREDEGGRKYALVEMGDHFDTVMLPRLKKAVYAPDWEDGKPLSRGKGISQLIECVHLESYEDTLDGLILTPPDGDLLAQDAMLAEDYQLRYAFGAETTDSPCLLGENFADPFAYTLSVVRDGARCEAQADLSETFNYLIGLRVASRRRLGGVLAISGRNAQGQSCLILWRNLERTDNAALEAWFAEHRPQLPDSLELIYVNGDHTLNAIRQPGETWIAETIEPRFRELMFETGSV